MAALKNIHVLIVDADTAESWACKAMLESRTEVGFTAEMVQTMDSALTRLQRGGIDAVLLGIYPPDTPVGEELIRSIKQAAPDIGTIVLVKWADAITTERVKSAGADGLLVKPPDPGEMSRKLQHSVIYRKNAADRYKLELVLDKLGAAMEKAVTTKSSDYTGGRHV